MWNDRYSAEGLSLWARASFDPATMTMAAMGATVAGGAVKAVGSLASGSYAQQAGQLQRQQAEFEAAQVDQNADQAIASSQRQMFDTQTQTRLLQSSLTARAGASGVAADSGSPVALAGQIAGRGSYQAAMDLFNGQSTATGLANKAAGIRYSGRLAELGGDEAKQASYLAAGGDILGSIGQGLRVYGGTNDPTKGGQASVRQR